MDQIPLPLDSLPPDPDVEADHDGDGQEEGEHRAQDGHDLVGLHELDVALLLLPLPLDVLPGIDGYHPHNTGQAPRKQYHQQGLKMNLVVYLKYFHAFRLYFTFIVVL